jgi:hypothetical protein
VQPLVRAVAVLQFKEHKLVFRRYAHLFFIMCIDEGDNELAVLEAIHLFVEILDNFFKSVTELDIVLNFHKVGTMPSFVCVGTPERSNLFGILVGYG